MAVNSRPRSHPRRASRATEVDGTARRPLADAILRLIWQERAISRAEIARRTGLSRSTVSELIEMLLPTGLVVEGGPGESSGGRRPIMLYFQDDACRILGVEMGSSHLAVALTNLRGHVLGWELSDHPVRSDPEGTRARVEAMCDKALRARKRRGQRLAGIGIAVACPVDPEHPFALSDVVLPEWHGASKLERLGQRFGVPVSVDNDANLGALAEQWWGAGRGIANFAYVKVGTGVGSGHVINGELYRGATGFAGEIGHLSLDPDGEICMCGQRGCLALLVGSPALIKRASELRAKATKRSRNGNITMAALEEAGLAGDPLALRVTREAAEYLGIAVSGMLNLMDPSVVIVGGGITALGDRFLGPLREAVRMRTRVSSGVTPSIVMSKLGPQSVAVGAATLVLKQALANPRLFPRPGRIARS
jgi:predicted NBD/HSP70 family sugar kinase